jgi:hypothetical protein
VRKQAIVRGDVDAADGGGDLSRPRHPLVGAVRRFEAEERHAADLEERQDDDGEADDADAADPLRGRAPQEDGGRHGVEARHHGAARGGHARDELEIGVDHREVGRLGEQRQPTEGGNHEPRDHGEEHGIAKAELEVAAAGGQDAGAAEDHGDRRRRREDLLHAVGDREGEQRHDALRRADGKADPPERQHRRPYLGKQSATPPIPRRTTLRHVAVLASLRRPAQP